VIVYFDTSALIKLFVAEDGSRVARLAWRAADAVAMSRLAGPEARAALAAAKRAGRLTTEGLATGKRELAWRLARSLVVEVSATVAGRAGELAERHAMRAYDAVHLASALQLGPVDAIATWDRNLREAAQREGVALIPATTG
jgi:predicted nucleic acid-binding protein